MNINEVQDTIIDEFSTFDDWMDRYSLLIDFGKDLPAIDPKYKVKDFLIEGCQSRVWLHPEFDGDVIKFTADSDAIITKGIVGLLVKVLSGRTPGELLSADLYFIDKIGLKENLSPTRSNGLVSMVKKMKMYSLAYHVKHNGQ